MKQLKFLESSGVGQTNTYTDLKTLKFTLTNKIDPFLRLQVKNRGITVFQNIYTGFDTEYELENYKKSLNKLISTQTAVQSRTIIKVPLYNSLDISYIHPLTSEVSSFYKPKVDE